MRHQAFKKITAAFFMLLYIFLLGFSQHFHDHSDKSFTKSAVEKSFTTSEDGTCFSCHFLYTGNALQDAESFEFTPVVLSKPQVFVDSYNSWGKIFTSYFFLRGPPASSL